MAAWGTPRFEQTLKDEIRDLEPGLLPLQQGLSQSSHVSESAVDVVIISITETPNEIRAKTGLFYAGVIAGSCCADDPTPLSENTEYCEVQLAIDKRTGIATATLL
jgi:hypothetical protein